MKSLCRVGRESLALSLILSITTMVIAEEEKHPTLDGPLYPESAIKSFKLEPDLQVELVANEPLIAAPVAMAFDARGRMFVVENRGYPIGPAEGQPPLGKIALLEDTNNDGAMDKRTEFADNLTFPNGILPWRDGAIVTCAPDILFFRDTNDDGIADVREVIFTGFATTGSTQLRVSHPTLAPDGWIYVANGLSGGKITSPKFPDMPPVELKRTTFRFYPDFSHGEAAGGPAQFGLCFDDFNRMFVCYNRVQVQHVVFSPQQLAKHPLGFSEMLHNCPAETVGEPLKGHGAAAKLYPISQNITTADSHAGTFTAACGVTIVRGVGLPKLYQGGVLSCDPTANLIHFDRLEPSGASFDARRLPGTTEFLRSSDSWFRPVFLTFGPDGALYVCDMYRKTIEHPDYLPAEIRKRTDFESGQDMGRIWRITDSSRPNGLANPCPLTAKNAEDLLSALAKANGVFYSLGIDHRHISNGWLEDAVHRLLVEKGEESIAPILNFYMAKGRWHTVPPRVIYLLDQMNSLSDESLRAALVTGSIGTRNSVLALAVKRIDKNESWLRDVLRSQVVIQKQNDRAEFHFALLMALHEACATAKQQDHYLRRVKEIGFEYHEDRWFRAALWNALAEVEPLKVGELFEGGYSDRRPVRQFNIEYGRLLAALDKEGTALKSFGFMWAYLPKDMRAEILLGITQGTKKDQADPLQKSIEKFLAEIPDAKLKRDESRFNSATLELFGYTTYDIAAETLWKEAASKDPNLQLLAVRSLGKLRDERAIKELFSASRWETFSPAAREEVIAAAFITEPGIIALFAAMDAGTVPLYMIDANRRQALYQHKNPEMREQSQQRFGQVKGDRGKVYEELKSVADEAGNAANGRKVFGRTCANCHRLNREGFAVGPDLFSIRNQPKAAILLHILVPDHEITPGFKAYQLITHDGRTLTGLLVGESDGAVTLRLPQGKEETIPRSEVEELHPSQLSLMPQGLEKTITRPEFADLLAYLKGERETPTESQR